VTELTTRVAIIGSGPAGLFLGHLLTAQGIDNHIIERRSREHVEARVRAGVIEHGVAALFDEAGAGERMRREGLIHHGVEIRFDGERHRIAFEELADGRGIVVYGQQEAEKDLIALRLAAGAPIDFEAEATAIDGVTSDAPTVTYRHQGVETRLRAEYVVGADGSLGLANRTIPESVVRRYERTYPFAWLGIIAQAPPATEELIYARHSRGFALYSMRSPTVSRLYLGVARDETLEAWPDERIWQELDARLGTEDQPHVTRGEITERSITPLRNIVVTPMSYGRLFLAGDSAHIVPPTGAKGMNAAIGDVRDLFRALMAALREGDDRLLSAYSDTALERIWRAEEFSTYMTQMLHPYEHDPFESEVQRSRLAQAVANPDVTRVLARNYVDLNSL
jgi:p-hydroxybenzoate 3-monooxygenase